MKHGSGPFCTIAVLVAGLALAGCRAEEQGRPLQYHQGVYQGKQDTQLSEAQVHALRGRIGDQIGASGFSGGGGTRSSDVSVPKSSDTLNWGALDTRLKQQETSEPQK